MSQTKTMMNSSALPRMMGGGMKQNSRSGSMKTKTSGSSGGFSTETFEIIIAAILIIGLVILVTLAIYYEGRRDRCYNNPSPWCFEDWECKDVPETDPRRFPAKNAQSIAVGCTLTNSGPKDPSCTNAWGIT